jgi:hypothetical protein
MMSHHVRYVIKWICVCITSNVLWKWKHSMSCIERMCHALPCLGVYIHLIINKLKHVTIILLNKHTHTYNQKHNVSQPWENPCLTSSNIMYWKTKWTHKHSTHKDKCKRLNFTKDESFASPKNLIIVRTKIS